MAEEENDTDMEEVIDPVALLKEVDQRSKTNKVLFVSVLSLSVIVISIMATGLLVMFMKISSLSEAANAGSEDAVEEQFLLLEQQLMLLADFRKSELKKVTTFTKQLEKVTNGCSFDKIAPYRDFLDNREVDYQKLLTAVESGTSNLAAMNKGSRQWLAAHKRELEDLQRASQVRRDKLAQIVRDGGGE